MAEIRLENIQKRFNENVVIPRLDLTIRNGEFFTFVGPSGCGKSTILNIIAGLETPSGGEISFDRNRVTELSPRERDIAMVFQSYALYPHMTVHDNLAFPLRMRKRGREEIRREVARVAELLGINRLLERKPGELSGGERQRVALGRAIIRRPAVFLMDEPLSNLDAKLRIEMRAELKRLHHELKITTVYVTHDQGEALGLSERIAVLRQGKIQQCGTPQEIYFAPANLFVAEFIGSPPMNFLRGVVRSVDPVSIECNGITISPGVECITGKNEVVLGVKVVLGVRPDDVTVHEERKEGSVEVTISVMEPAGSFNWADMVWNGRKLKGTADAGAKLQVGGKAYALFRAEKFLVFDQETGVRI